MVLILRDHIADKKTRQPEGYGEQHWYERQNLVAQTPKPELIVDIYGNFVV